jgi:hypothetical protein
MVKFTLPAEQESALLLLLDREKSINQASLMPTLGNVSTTLRLRREIDATRPAAHSARPVPDDTVLTYQSLSDASSLTWSAISGSVSGLNFGEIMAKTRLGPQLAQAAINDLMRHDLVTHGYRGGRKVYVNLRNLVHTRGLD